MPECGVTRLDHEQILSIEEIYRIADILTDMGIKRIRLTGGEPLVRRGIDDLLGQLGSLPDKPAIALTTNGLLLEDKIDMLKSAGVKDVNISLDTRDTAVFKRLTGTDALDKVERSIKRAVEEGLKVKLNSVILKGLNDDGIEQIVAYAKDYDIDVRFIELMPIGPGADYEGVTGDEILNRLALSFGKATLVTDSSGIINGPARYVHFAGFKGNVGFIDPMTHAFCSRCNRIRLTVDGMLKLCLYYEDGLDLKAMLRSGCTDEEIGDAIAATVLGKPKEHEFNRNCIDTDNEKKDRRDMFQIGG